MSEKTVGRAEEGQSQPVAWARAKAYIVGRQMRIRLISLIAGVTLYMSGNRKKTRLLTVVVKMTIAGAVCCCQSMLLAQGTRAQDDSTAVEYLSIEARALMPLVTSQPAKKFLDAVKDLPTPTEPRVAYINRTTHSVKSAMEYHELSDSAKTGYERREFDDVYYYYTRYGTPLAFVRPLDLVGNAGFSSLDGARVIDFGFGSIGQLRLMASLGASVDGIDVDPLLGIIYGTPADTGMIARSRAAGAGQEGSLHVHIGSFPSDSAITQSLGHDYDVFFSKNTLKRGYIHPERTVDPRMLVHLGVDDSTFVRRVYDLLKPGGFFMIYNLHPARSKPEDEKYIPWSDGRCPFDRGLLERTGFMVIAFDTDDTRFAHKMAIALGWDKEMNLETDLFGTYSLFRK
jgi:hypothetical protein